MRHIGCLLDGSCPRVCWQLFMRVLPLPNHEMLCQISAEDQALKHELSFIQMSAAFES